jgi:hypothetical protein
VSKRSQIVRGAIQEATSPTVGLDFGDSNQCSDAARRIAPDRMKTFKPGDPVIVLGSGSAIFKGTEYEGTNTILDVGHARGVVIVPSAVVAKADAVITPGYVHASIDPTKFHAALRSSDGAFWDCNRFRSTVELAIAETMKFFRRTTRRMVY